MNFLMNQPAQGCASPRAYRLPRLPRLARQALSVLALAAMAALGACAIVPSHPSQAKLLTPEQAGLDAAAAPTALHQDWWQDFHDAQLDALMARALADSPNLVLAQARISRAAAVIESAQAAELPNASLAVDASRQRFTENGIYPAPLAGSVRNLGTIQANVGYDFDFFGRHKAELEAALGRQRAAQAEQASARLLLATQITRGYLSLARVLAQAELLQTQMQLREQALSLTRQRVQAGLDTSVELRGAESPLPELRRQHVVLGEQAEILRHQLAALSAQPPSATATLNPKLPEASLPLGPVNALSLDLLGRRPDVLAARWRVEASAQDVASARTQFYPDISLSAFAGFNAIGFDKVLKSGSYQAGFGPSLHLPLFDSGRLRAQLRGSVAEQDAAIASYNAALLDAVRDASDQLSTLQSQQGQRVEQEALLRNAHSSLELASQRYAAGLSTQLPVLSARQQWLQQSRQALDLRAQTLDAQVSLLRSLGGAPELSR